VGLKGCGRKIGPYECCTVVCGDCLELMKALPDGCVDAVITDPPYGMRCNTDYTRFSGGNTRRGSGSSYDAVIGDESEFDPGPFLRFNEVVIWGANHFWSRLPAGGALVWLKRNDRAFGTFLSDAELAFLKGRQGVFAFRYVFAGSSKAIDAGLGAYEKPAHPTQKPVALMVWCLSFVHGETVLDPFLGSGTTAVAAKKLGRHFLGFEISPEYCEIARKRIEIVEMQPSLFEKRAEQDELFAEDLS
jgi:DNA modification methylase